MYHSETLDQFSICHPGMELTTMPGFMDKKIKIALIGAGMFGGDVHARAYADLQRAGISPQLGRVGLDEWARDLAPIKFELVAVATRSEQSAKRAQQNFKGWTGSEPKVYSGARPWLEVL